MRTAAACAVALVLSGAGAARAQDAGGGGALDADGFLRAILPREWSFPADHGSHPETRTEWWYLTGPLQAEDGRQFGFQATWFRRALVSRPPQGRSPLAARDVLLFHGALTDVAGGRLLFGDQACRAYAPWARAGEGGLDLELLGHSWTAPGGELSRTQLDFGAQGARLRLELDLSAGRPLLHGRQPGLSIKGGERGQASFYVSFPRLPVKGTLRLAGGETLAVTGSAWFDHEFGSSQLGPGQAGWDWFSTALDDGTDLMLYRMRLADGSADATSSGTVRIPGRGAGPGPGAGPDPGEAGAATHLEAAAFTLEETGEWTSPHTGTRYPSGWVLRVPQEQLELRVEPALEDQELRTPGSTGVTYWEGLCRFTGTRAGRPVSGWGYVELVGYDRRFVERL